MSPDGGDEICVCVAGATVVAVVAGLAVSGTGACGSAACPRRHVRRQTLILDERDVLRLAVLGDHEVLGGQAFDRLAVLVLDEHRLDDQPRGGAEGGLRCLRLRLLLLRHAATERTRR